MSNATVWHVNTNEGRLPPVREVKQPHSEASVYKANILEGPEGGYGNSVCILDFGYGYAGKPAMEKVARLIAAAPELKDELWALAVAYESDYKDLTGNDTIPPAIVRARQLLARIDTEESTSQDGGQA